MAVCERVALDLARDKRVPQGRYLPSLFFTLFHFDASATQYYVAHSYS